MANPQSYQPLSHALHPPVAGPSQSTPTYTSYSNPAARDEDIDEEDEGDEGTVEEQLNRVDPDGQGSSPSSPSTKPNSPSGPNPSPQDTEPKRRPGRPKGSKNRRPRATTSHPHVPKPPVPLPHTPLNSSATTATAPRHPDVNTHNQQYYEFQWRVLNLCAEFYTAAEELVKGTQPLVIAQCYSSPPANKVDPLAMLSEAKRICDTLLANPTKLITHPPPPMYPPAPNIYQAPPVTQPPLPLPLPPAPKPSMAPPTVITQPQSFVVPMGAQYPVYHQVPGAYPPTPYYQYGYHPPASQSGNYYPPQPNSTQTSPSTASTEESTARSVTMKDRGVKRRRADAEDPGSPAPPSANSVAQNTASPHSQSTSTPIASPSLQQRPTPVTPATSTSGLSWPMPTVAASTPSPVIAANDQRVTSYYRPRPSDPKPPAGHTYIAYQPNGTTSRLSQNGK